MSLDLGNDPPWNHCPDSSNFTTTQWSLVLEIGAASPGRGGEALEQLCRRYWNPIHGFIRHRVGDFHRSEDLTQAFFEFVIEHHLFEKARKERGRFRSFILSSLNNFLHNQHDHASAVKRGGRHQIVSLDETEIRDKLAETTDTLCQQAFDKEWALALVRRVMERLHADFARRGKSDLHDALLPYLTASVRSGEDYERISDSLGMDSGTFRVAVHRFRHRFGELLRSEIAHTVADPAEVEDELRHLLAILAEHWTQPGCNREVDPL